MGADESVAVVLDASVPVAVATDASELVAVGLEETSALLVCTGRSGPPSEGVPEDAAPSLGVPVDTEASAEEEPDVSVGPAGLVASVPAAVPVTEEEPELSEEPVLAVADVEAVAETPAGLSIEADTPEGSELGTPHVAPSLALGDAGAVAPAGCSDDVPVGTPVDPSELEVAETAAAAESVLPASDPPVGCTEELSVAGSAEFSVEPRAPVVDGADVIVAVMSAKSCEAEGTTGQHHQQGRYENKARVIFTCGRQVGHDLFHQTLCYLHTSQIGECILRTRTLT